MALKEVPIAVTVSTGECYKYGSYLCNGSRVAGIFITVLSGMCHLGVFMGAGGIQESSGDAIGMYGGRQLKNKKREAHGTSLPRIT